MTATKTQPPAVDPTLFAAGEPPKQATSSVMLGFGPFVTIRLQVLTGLDDGIKVSRGTYTKDGNPVGKKDYDKVTNKDVGEDGKVMKATSSDGVLVDLTDDEIVEVTGGGDDIISSIETFIPLETIGRLYRPVSEHQLRPKKLEVGKKKIDDPGNGKAFLLLLKSMEERGVAALFRMSLRGPVRYAALTPDGRMIGLAFVEQVRADAPMPEIFVQEAEMKMGLDLIDIVGVGTPVLHDENAAKIQAYVDAKASGVVEDEPEVEQVKVDTSGDLMAQLAASIEAAQAAKGATKKPARRRKAVAA